MGVIVVYMHSVFLALMPVVYGPCHLPAVRPDVSVALSVVRHCNRTGLCFTCRTQQLGAICPLGGDGLHYWKAGC